MNLSTKHTRKRESLMQMERVVPWAALVALITPYAPESRRGRPFANDAVHPLYAAVVTLSDPGTEEALHDVPLFREFAGLN